MTRDKFKKLCIEAAKEALNDEPMFVEDYRKKDAFEDDGSLHVISNKIRAIFDVGNGQSLDGEDQNARTKVIMGKLGLEVSDRVLVDETSDDDGDVCPNCGYRR